MPLSERAIKLNQAPMSHGMQMQFALNTTYDEIVVLPVDNALMLQQGKAYYDDGLEITVIDNDSYEELRSALSLPEIDEDMQKQFIVHRLDTASGYGTPMVSNDGWQTIYDHLRWCDWTPQSILKGLPRIIMSYHEADAFDVLSDADIDFENLSPEQAEIKAMEVLEKDEYKTVLDTYDSDDGKIFVYSAS